MWETTTLREWQLENSLQQCSGPHIDSSIIDCWNTTVTGSTPPTPTPLSRHGSLQPLAIFPDSGDSLWDLICEHGITQDQFSKAHPGDPKKWLWKCFQQWQHCLEVCILRRSDEGIFYRRLGFEGKFFFSMPDVGYHFIFISPHTKVIFLSKNYTRNENVQWLPTYNAKAIYI